MCGRDYCLREATVEGRKAQRRMASSLPQREWESHQTELVLLPSPIVAPQQQSLPEHVVHADGILPCRPTPQAACHSPRNKSMLLPPPIPLRRIFRSCGSSEPTKPRAPPKRCVRRMWSALRSGCCLFAAGMAILMTYWSLFPMCTTCDGGGVSSDSISSAAEAAGMDVRSAETGVQPFSTLRINQLQVRGCMTTPGAKYLIRPRNDAA